MPYEKTGRPRGRPVGWRKPPPLDAGPKSVVTKWPEREGYKTFGDRLNFLSEENNQLASGKLRILSPKNPEKRDK